MLTERFKNYMNELNLDFVKWRYHFATVSGLMVLGSWLLFIFVGPNWGIDFTGGTEIHLKFAENVAIEDVRGAMSKIGVASDAVYNFGPAEAHEFKIRIQDPNFGVDEAEADIRARLEKGFGKDWIQDATFSSEVGIRGSIVYKGEPVSVAEVRPLFADVVGVNIRPGVGDHELDIRLPGVANQIQRDMAGVLTDQEFVVLQVDSIGPKVGSELRVQAFIALAATLLLIMIYVAFRFEFSFAPGAIIALIHDTSLVAGAFVLTQREFNLSIIGALLTIIGYSLNDTVVIYDRLRENREMFPRMPTTEVINKSVNETMVRTITTSGATMLAMLPFLVIGGPVLADFSFAMVLGMVFGTYSTIYIASPGIILMEDLQPYLQRLIAASPVKAASPGATDAAPAPVAPAAPNAVSASAAPSAATPPTAPTAGAPVSESERRRRERAALEQAQGGRRS